ncbi:MAG: hypothetical protein JSW55_15925 [Chloroflexota bacterium]|nr:MAG: hypothetical protein JSW55_15925 [Chloroflexota bacterium]
MNSFDADPLRALFEHLGIRPVYLMPSLAAWQLQASNPQKDLPVALSVSVDTLRDLAVTSKDFLQIGVFEFFVGLDFLQARRSKDAVEHFDSARRQWIFIDHLPLIALAHMGAGMAHQGAGEFKQAMAAYFKVKQCLQDAEKEPYRLEKLERKSSLQDFWNDLESLLRQAVGSLQRDFDSQQEERLKSDLGDETDFGDEVDLGEDADAGISTDSDADSAPPTPDEANDTGVLTLNMQPPGALSATDVNDLLYQTIAEIEVLNGALSLADEPQARRLPEVSKIAYAEQAVLTVEVVNVSQHVLLFCRWLMAILPARPGPAEAGGDQAGAPPTSDGRQVGADFSRSWFRLQVESGRVANLIKAYVKSVTKREPEDREIERLVQVIVHLAELRANYQLTLC